MTGDERSPFTKKLEEVCLSLIEQGKTEVMARDIAQKLNGYDSQKVGSALWANTGDMNYDFLMKEVNVEVIGEEDGANVYHLSVG